MGKLSKDIYDKKASWASERMERNKEIESLTGGQHNALSTIASKRHNLHVSSGGNPSRYDSEGYYNFFGSTFLDGKGKLMEIIEENNLPKFKPYLIIDEFTYLGGDEWNDDEIDGYDENLDSGSEDYDKKYDAYLNIILNNIELLDQSVRDYLAYIDYLYGTNYAPSRGDYSKYIEKDIKMEKGGNIKRTTDGKKGGILYGKSHAQGGIKAVVTDAGNKEVELEGGEAVVKKSALKDKTVKTLTGTNAQILNLINTRAGGNPIYAPSDVKMAKGGSVEFKGSRISDKTINEETDFIAEYLEDNGFFIRRGARSRTDFGESNYLYAHNKVDEGGFPMGDGVKIRISDHSVSNFDRMYNEIHVGITDTKESWEKSAFSVLMQLEWWYDKNNKYRKEDAVEIKKVTIEIHESQLRTNPPYADKILSERISNNGKKRLTVERTYSNPIEKWYHKESGNYYTTIKPNVFDKGGSIDNKDNIKNKWKSVGNMTKAEQKAFYNTKEGKALDKETYTKWKSLVNMSKGEVDSFYNSKEGKEAGLSASEAKAEGIDSGRESARWIMKMKDIPYTEWTSNMWGWAKKQISFVSRMKGMRGDLYDDKGNKTRKHLALLIWGHNPQKMAEGGSIEDNCISFIKNSEAIKNNGYLHYFKNTSIYAEHGTKVPKVKSFYLCTYNSGGQKNLKVTDTINPLALTNELQKLIGCEKSVCRILIDEFMRKAKRIQPNDLIGMIGGSIVVADRDKIVCDDIKNEMAEGGNVGEITFTDYKGEQIMYEPHNREYFVIGNDENIFKSLDEAKAFIDNPYGAINTEYAKMVRGEMDGEIQFKEGGSIDESDLLKSYGIGETFSTKEFGLKHNISTALAYKKLCALEDMDLVFKYGYKTRNGWDDVDNSNLKPNSLHWQIALSNSDMDDEDDIEYKEGGNLKNALKDLESARSVKYWLEPEFSSEAYKYEQKGNPDSFVKIYDEKYNADTILAYNKRSNLVGLFSISKGGKEQGTFKIVVREDSMNQGWGKKLLNEAEKQGIDIVGNIKNNSFTNGGRNLLRSWLGKKMKANN